MCFIKYQLMYVSTVVVFTDRVSVRPSRGAAAYSSSLYCLDECLETDSPVRLQKDEDSIDFQRRSFEQLIIARSKQSLDRADMFTVDIGVQTEQVS